MKTVNVNGFTLIEMIACIAVLAILCAFAYPSFQSMFARFEAKKTISTLKTVVQHSKHQAYMYHQRLALCGSINAVDCSDNGWAHYILLFKDSNPNRLRDNEEKILQIIPMNLKHGTLKWNGASARNIVFHADSGLPRGANGSFYYCSHSHAESHTRLFLSDMGHIRSEKLLTC